MEDINESIKAIFVKLLESGKVRGELAGPKKNILVCKTTNDWIIAGNEFAIHGFTCTSPGGYGGSSPTDRTNTYNKIWKSGTVCASVVEKKVLLFTMPQTVFDFCDVVHKRN